MSNGAMKITIDRIVVMKSLAKKGAFAMPNRYIPIEFQSKGLQFVGEKMWGALVTRKYVKEARPPKKELRKGPSSVGFVWVITDKGRAWISHAEKTIGYEVRV